MPGTMLEGRFWRVLTQKDVKVHVSAKVIVTSGTTKSGRLTQPEY